MHAIRKLSETVIEPLPVIHVERRRLFVMERTRRPHIALSLIGLTVVPNDLRLLNCQLLFRAQRLDPSLRITIPASGHHHHVAPLMPVNGSVQSHAHILSKAA